ncbi:hypothetical protein Tco_0016417 [Tanacetum coccineum]
MGMRGEAWVLEEKKISEECWLKVCKKVELYEDEQGSSFCHGSCFQICERMRHRDVVIGNIMARENHQIACRDVSYLREMQDHDMDRIQFFRNMVRDSYHRVRRKRWFISMVTAV